jgi:GNAT superfamily N-acetyltransferase
MYALNILEKSTAVNYEKLTFPSFRNLLRNIDTEESVVAIAVSVEDQPVGLAVAQIKEYDKSAEVLSIFVKASYRGQGLGTALLNRLEEELQIRGCVTTQMVYMAGQSTTPALETLIQKSNWQPSQPRMLVCKGNVTQTLEAPWVSKYSHIPTSYSIFPWREITEQEREAIIQKQETQPWIPDSL